MSDEQLKNKIQVGKVRDSHGLKGELFIVTSLEKTPAWVEAITEFTLHFKSPNEKGQHEPRIRSFKVKKTRPHKKGFIVKADELETRNDSDLFIGAGFYIEQSYLESKTGEKLYLNELKGSTVFNQNEEVGPIVAFGTNNAQDLLVVETSHGLREIPFVEAFIEKLDIENKKVFLNLPSGLVDSDENENPDDEDN